MVTMKGSGFLMIQRSYTKKSKKKKKIRRMSETLLIVPNAGKQASLLFPTKSDANQESFSGLLNMVNFRSSEIDDREEEMPTESEESSSLSMKKLCWGAPPNEPSSILNELTEDMQRCSQATESSLSN